MDVDENWIIHWGGMCVASGFDCVSVDAKTLTQSNPKATHIQSHGLWKSTCINSLRVLSQTVV